MTTSPQCFGVGATFFEAGLTATPSSVPGRDRFSVDSAVAELRVSPLAVREEVLGRAARA